MKLSKEVVTQYCNVRKAIKQKVETLIDLWGEADCDWKLEKFEILTVDGRREVLAKVLNKGWKKGKWTRWYEYYDFPVKYLALTKPQIKKEFAKDIASGKMSKIPTIKPFKK